MARTLLFLIRYLRPKEGTHERQRLASSYSWYRFPGLSHLSRLEARGWLLEVDDLLVGEQGHKMCFLQVASWRFLGLGATKSFDASGRGLN